MKIESTNAACERGSRDPRLTLIRIHNMQNDGAVAHGLRRLAIAPEQRFFDRWRRVNQLPVFLARRCSVMLTPLQPVLESALAPRVSTSAVIEPGPLRSKLSDRAELITFSDGSIRGGGAPDLLSASDPTQRDRAQSVPRSKCRGGRAAPLPAPRATLCSCSLYGCDCRDWRNDYGMTITIIT